MHSVVILAAGNSSRIKRTKSKIFLKINKKTLIDSTIELAKKTKPKEIYVIIKRLDLKYFKFKKYKKIKFLLQKKPLGTGDAFKTFFNSYKGHSENFLILYGDTPFIKLEDINKMINSKKANPITILGFKTRKNKDLGLIKVNEKKEILRIIEYKNSNKNQKKINICNSGVVYLNKEVARYVKKIKKDKLSKEYYLTDIVKVLRQHGILSSVVLTKNILGSKGINTIKDYNLNKTELLKRTHNTSKNLKKFS